MKNKIICFFLVILCGSKTGKAQDTFSILAFDSITREVGAAGASCVDLFNTTFTSDFICELFPDTGAIACQASYITPNQVAARSRMRLGDSPTQLISWIKANDAGGSTNAYNTRQYGVVNMNQGYSRAAAFTGTNCSNYKGHRIGRNYTIHGNILLGPQILDSMEARFLRAEGDLACKLMSAMQGAKVVGADTRCAGNNSSTLFGFVKVMQPTDTFGRPSFLVSLRTHYGDLIEPIDSLQVMFDAVRSCTVSTVGLKKITGGSFKIYPNPVSHQLRVTTAAGIQTTLQIRDLTGKVFLEAAFRDETLVDLKSLPAGIYFVELRSGELQKIEKLVIE